jgi:hypothetical protein
MPLIVCFVNCVLKKGFPLQYKHAVITPIIKNSSLDSNDVKNYRPISNFPTLAKIIERVIARKVIDHLERNELFDQYQSAYRTHHSCETAVLSILNDIYAAADRREISIAALLDMSAAFDTVDHELLIMKLANINIIDDALNWIRTYLRDRTHLTQVGDITSTSLPLMMGVPQGSVLGPLLFTIYIRELSDVINGAGVRYGIYADDVQLLVHTKPPELSTALRQIGDCVTSIFNWTSNNWLQLNSKKTEFIIFGTREQLKKTKLDEVVVNGERFQIQSVVRNLGIFLDSQLKFTKHVDNICRAAYSNLHMLHRLRRPLSNSQFAVLVHSLVLSRIEYAPSVLYGVDECELKKLQRVIKASFRFTYQFKRNEKISEEMLKRGWLTIKQRIVMRLLLIIHTMVTSHAPKYLMKLVAFSSSDYGLRSQTRGDLSASRSTSTIGSRSFKVAAPHIWRSVDDEIRKFMNHFPFRHALKKWIIEQNKFL